MPRLTPRRDSKPAFAYLVVKEPFYSGSRYFAQGAHVHHTDPLARKRVERCPQWVHPVAVPRSERT